jgi:PAS domain S-box-containing protein
MPVISEAGGPSRGAGLVTRGMMLLPLFLVVLSLSALSLIPLISMRRAQALRSRISVTAEPARTAVTQIRNAVALEGATRGFLLIPDDEARTRHLQARAERQRALGELRQLAPRLGVDVESAVTTLAARTGALERLLDTLLGTRATREAYLAQLPAHEARLRDVLDGASIVDERISQRVRLTRRGIQRIASTSATMTMVFVLFAVIAAILVWDLGKRFRESEGRFRQIAEALRDFLWLGDTRMGRPLFVNAAYERIWGRPREELYRHPLSMLDGVHPDDRPLVQHAIANLPKGTYDIEFRVVRPDGTIRWVWSRGFPVRNDRGEIYRVAGITEDITDRKLAAEGRTRLIRGFTHDVKNPLGAADGYLQLFEAGTLGTLSPKQAESVGHIRRSIRTALNLIAQLLDIARAEAGQLKVDQTNVDITQATRDVVDEFRAEAEAKHIALRIDIPSRGSTHTPLVVRSDYARVCQILANLLSNAVKYTGANGRVTVSATATSNGESPGAGKWAAITIDDSGPGIPFERQNMLFQEFTRFSSDATQGSGIGLAISQRVAGALHGAITVKSKPGIGSAFTLWLPMGPPVRERSQA